MQVIGGSPQNLIFHLFSKLVRTKCSHFRNNFVFRPVFSKDVLDWAVGVAGDKLITCYMHDVKHVLQLRSLASGDILHTFKGRSHEMWVVVGGEGELITFFT